MISFVNCNKILNQTLQDFTDMQRKITRNSGNDSDMDIFDQLNDFSACFQNKIQGISIGDASFGLEQPKKNYSDLHLGSDRQNLQRKNKIDLCMSKFGQKKNLSEHDSSESESGEES